MTFPKLGFSILSHKFPDNNFYKLLKRLREFPDAEIVVHHDFSQSEFPESLIQEFNLKMVNPHRKTSWSHISNVWAILDTFEALYKTPVKPDWYITLSASCYPVKTTSYILEFFKKAESDVYMNADTASELNPDLAKWFNKALFTKKIGTIPIISLKGKVYEKDIRVPISKDSTPFHAGNTFFHGSDWFMLNSKAMKILIDANLYNDPVVEYLKEINENPDVNVCPPEVVFQTFFANRKDIVLDKNNFRFIDWKDSKNWHPNVLTLEHYAAIKNSDALFARKFDSELSKDLINRIDQEILQSL